MARPPQVRRLETEMSPRSPVSPPFWRARHNAAHPRFSEPAHTATKLRRVGPFLHTRDTGYSGHPWSDCRRSAASQESPEPLRRTSVQSDIGRAGAPGQPEGPTAFRNRADFAAIPVAPTAPEAPGAPPSQAVQSRYTAPPG